MTEKVTFAPPPPAMSQKPFKIKGDKGMSCLF